MHRRTFVLATTALTATAALAATAPARAATQAPFTQQAFAAARDAGKPILIAVHASWCPVCAKQAPIINSLAQKPEYQNLTILTVDFDSQKDVLKTFGVTKQSTLIALHGAAERGRAVGITAQDEIQALFLKTKA